MEKSSFKEFFKFLIPYKKKIGVIFLLQIIIISCSIFVPYKLGQVIHHLEINNVNFSYLVKSFVILIGVYLIWDTSDVVNGIFFEWINKGVENDIRSYCYTRILNSPMAKVQGKSEGEIITKVIRDTEKVEKTFSNMFKLSYSVVNSIAIITMMIIVSPILGSIVISLFSIIAITQRLMSKPLKELYGQYKSSEESLLTDLRNQISGFLTIKVFSLEDKSINLLKNRNSDNFKNHIKINTKVSVIKNFNFFIASVFRVASIVIGGGLYLIKKINIGQIFSVYTYSIQLSYELRNIIEIDILLKDIKVSFKRIMEFLHEYDELDMVASNSIESIHSLNFENVNFKYDKKQLINNLSFTSKKGSVIGIKGENGCGKTTLTYLLCGFYKPEGIFINNIPIASFSENAICKRVSYVLQNVYLFPATVMENLTCFGNIPHEEVYEVCKNIGLHDKIMKLPKGYETIINEKNLNLSGGEKQLISLARALLKDSDVLILDEMNSALDSATEDKLLTNIEPYLRDKIIFIISHRERVFNMCDTIIDLNKNNVYTQAIS